MRYTSLHRALPIVATALGRKFGVQVAIQGNRAATNGNTIVLPVLPDDRAVHDVAWGYLAHEAAHVRYTDFETYQKSGTSPLRNALTNTLEDVRIEKALAHEYPGTRETIGSTVAHVLKEGGFAPDSTSPAGVLTSHVLLKLRSEVLGQDTLVPLAKQADEVLRKTFPKGAVTRLHGLLAEAHNLDTTADALRLTDSIIKMLKEEQEKAKNETKQSTDGKRKGASSGQAGNAEGHGAKGTDGAIGGKQAGDMTDQRASDSPTAQQLKALQGALDAKADEVTADVFAEAAQLLNEQSAEGIRQHGWIVLPAAEIADGTEARKQKVLSDARAHSNRLRAQLTGLVQSARDESRITKRSGRRLDRGRLHRLAVGDPRVFVSVLEHPAPNTAVHLLVDVSGSMKEAVPKAGSSRCQLALDSAVALSLALESIRGVNPAVTAFPGFGAPVQVLQRHNESIRRVAGRFEQTARGGTPMYEALWYAGTQLCLQPEPRKVLLVLTDGDPARSHDVKRVVGELEERGGIDVYGIGIATMVVNDLFRRHHVIHDVSELRTALFEIARAALLAA